VPISSIRFFTGEVAHGGVAVDDPGSWERVPLDDACLVGMERELVPSETLAQNIQNPLGIPEVRERPSRRRRRIGQGYFSS
jgi:hypothetical protein